VSVKVHRSCIEHVLVLRDCDGRRTSVVMADLRLDPAVRRQLARDVRTSLQAGAVLPPKARALLVTTSPAADWQE
jgi:hypothetical protein